jgi:hypothetical protein
MIGRVYSIGVSVNIGNNLDEGRGTGDRYVYRVIVAA